MNCKFVVIATVWSEEEKKQVKVICGMFAKFVDAVLFSQAYSEFYKTATEIKKWIVCACKCESKFWFKTEKERKEMKEKMIKEMQEILDKANEAAKFSEKSYEMWINELNAVVRFCRSLGVDVMVVDDKIIECK